MELKPTGNLLITYLITDAPCHGKQYNGKGYRKPGTFDKWPDQPEGILENLVTKYVNMNKKQDFYMLELNENITKHMFNIMNKASKGKFRSIHVSDVKDLKKLIIETANQSM